MRKHLRFSWSTPTDGISVFVLFLFVSALHCRRHITLTIAQSRYLLLAFQTWSLVGKWHLINPRHPIHANGVRPQLQRYSTRNTHTRYAWILSICLLWDANDHGQMYGPNFPDPKVRSLCVNSDALVHSCPDRTYAITRKNKLVAGILYTISGVQFVGIYMTIRAAVKPGQYLLSIARIYAQSLKLRKSFSAAAILPTPLDSYRLCISNVQEAFTIIQLSLSLVFGRYFVHFSQTLHSSITYLAAPTDVAVFALTVIQNKIMKSRNRGIARSSILDTVSRDAGIYFALITMFHFLILIVYLAAGVRSSVLVFETDGC